MSPNLADVKIQGGIRVLRFALQACMFPDEGGLAAVTLSRIKNAGVDNENVYGSFFRIVFWTRCRRAKFELAGEHRSAHGGRQNSHYVLHSRIERIVILVPST